MSLEQIEVLRNKIQNAQKRFRQGRMPYKKLQGIVRGCKQEAQLIISKLAADMKLENPPTDEVEIEETHEHIHGEHCNHGH